MLPKPRPRMPPQWGARLRYPRSPCQSRHVICGWYAMYCMRHKVAALFLAIAASAPAAAWSQSVRAPEIAAITIRLSSFAFSPEQVRQRAGVPIRLHLVNESDGGHNFCAPEFFAAGSVTSGSVPLDGTVEVSGGRTVDITVVPRMPGTYKVRCTHFLHGFFGMTGHIVVERPPP